MKKAYEIETLVIFVAGSTGILGWIMPNWIASLVVYTLGFGLTSITIGLLKEETILEYNRAVADAKNLAPKGDKDVRN